MNLAKIPIIPSLIALICVIALSSLGMWQLQRKTEKELRLTQLNERKELAPFSLDELVSSNGSIQDYPAKIEGELLSNKVFYIDNKIHEGSVGFQVLIPLRTNRGIVLLNHGWLQGLGARGLLPDLPSKGTTSRTEDSIHKALSHGHGNTAFSVFQGMVAYPSDNKMIKETNQSTGQFPALLQQIDLSLMQAYFDEELLPFVLNLAPDNTSAYVREWKPVVMPPEKHLGYAIQWFGLAIACLTIYLISLIQLNQSISSQKA